MYWLVISSKKPGYKLPVGFYQEAYSYLENLFFNLSLLSIRVTEDGRTASIIRANSPEEVLAGLIINYPCSSCFYWEIYCFDPESDIYDVDAQWKKLSGYPWRIQTTEDDIMSLIENIIESQRTAK